MGPTHGIQPTNNIQPLLPISCIRLTDTVRDGSREANVYKA